jgi:CelD/BcsL family acetyltransferase involved in cellulose biosynthesis
VNWVVSPLLDTWPTREADWSRLNASHHAGHPLLAAEFVGPLVTHYGEPADRLAVLCHGAQPTAMLMLRRHGLRWRTFMPAQTQIAPMLLAEPARLEQLWRALGASAVALELMCQDSEHSTLPDAPLHARHELACHATTLNVRIEGSFAQYWKARSKSLQSDIRSKFNRLHSDGHSVRLEVRESAPEVQEALLRYAEMESRSWKTSQGTALQVGSRQTAFYADVLARFCTRGGASIFELYLGDELAASELVVRSAGMAVLLKTSHDARMARYAPGFLLDHLLLEHEFALRRVAVVEFYTQASEQKLRWGTGSRAILHHTLYRWMLARHAVDLSRRARALLNRWRTTSVKTAPG